MPVKKQKAPPEHNNNISCLIWKQRQLLKGSV